MKDDIRAAVYLLAQNRLVREALSRILANENDIVVVGSSSLSEASVREVVATTPDVLVIDSFATGSSHMDFVHELQQELSAIKLLVIDVDLDAQHFLEAIREGVMGCWQRRLRRWKWLLRCGPWPAAAQSVLRRSVRFCSALRRSSTNAEFSGPRVLRPDWSGAATGWTYRSRAHKQGNCHAPKPCGEDGAQQSRK